MMTDPIADMLARIRNAGNARHKSVNIPHSKLKMLILDVLKESGYIGEFSVIEAGVKSHINVNLRYDAETRSSAIAGIQRVSRPGRRVYVATDEIPKVLSGLGVNILSTSYGVLTDREARSRKTGGEVLLKVW
jgi:small subunit ribosomal protein S8